MTNVSTKLKNAIKRVPGTQTLYFKLAGLRLPRSTEDVFRSAIRENKWGVNDSESGGGSDLHQTRAIRERLPTLWSDFDIGTVLDLPCGDFYWMRHVPMDGIRYIGADILPELVERNGELYGNPHVTFRRMNMLEDPLPEVDLVLCRDCLVHFSYRDVEAALRNICDSGSTYLLTTTFTERRRNHDIATGQFRPLNLEAQPLSLPAPILVINEGCTEGDGKYQDKSLGLWSVSDIRARLDGDRL
ncbi:class I SAM-dependent methyltransferase [Mycobacterium sp. NPDC048908]|uniref:class I SAM-dependent methyltransferase n=1 Tax=Mycobacterium sp. NPDC048908 TaxID=3364292 RepID=UPI00371A7BA2